MLDSSENRSHQLLQAYWDKLRGDRPFPPESAINPDDLHEIWASCFLISIDDVTRRIGYRYSYLGEDLIEAYGDNISSVDVAHKLLSTATSSMISKFDEVVARRHPVIDESEFVNLKNLKIRYRTCMLPLGTDGGEVTHILGCMRWKIC